MSAREQLVQLALAVENVGQKTAPAKYLDLLASSDPADQTAQMRAYFMNPQTDSCGLTVRGLWRRMGLCAPELGAYTVGAAGSELMAIANRSGAYVNGYDLAGGKYTPEPGDMIHVGYPGPEHVATIISVTPAGDGWDLVTIDGGQTIDGAQIITKRYRSWRRVGNLYADEPKFGGSVKQVLGVVDVSRLPFPAMTGSAAGFFLAAACLGAACAGGAWLASS